MIWFRWMFFYQQVWLQVQRKWIYLEGIFGGGDISKQLPEQAKFFDKIDKQFKKVTKCCICCCELVFEKKLQNQLYYLMFDSSVLP